MRAPDFSAIVRLFRPLRGPAIERRGAAPQAIFGRNLARTVLASAALAGVTACATACDRAPSPNGLREWTAADHGRDDVPPGAEAAQAQAAKASPATGADRFAAVVDATWANQCALCHGTEGRGDGPQGPMFRAPDLTRADWQASVTDDAIAETITTGRGRMPKFDLPPEVTEGLVRRIRALGSAGSAAPER